MLIVLGVALSGTYGSAQEKPRGSAPVMRGMSEPDSMLFSREFFAGLKAKTLGNTEAALGHFSKCVQLNPAGDAAWYELAILHYSRGAEQEALKMINNAIAMNDRQPWYLGLKADLLQKEGKYEEIVKTFTRLIELQPANMDHYYNKANALLAISRTSEALEVYEQIEAAEGPGTGLTLARQRVYLKKGETEKAIEEINGLIRKYPGEAQYYLILGELYDAGDRPGKALDSYRKALRIEPENGYARLAIADHYRTNGKYKDSYEELKRAFRSPGLRIDAKIKILLDNYIKPGNSLARWDQGEELAGILMAVYPRDARAYAVAGDILLQQDKQAEARNAYQEAVKYEKNILLLWEQLLRLEIAQDNYQGIEKTSKEALEYFPEQADFYLFNGVASMQLGKYSEALASLNKGLALAGDSALKLQFYSNLGDAYHATGNHAASDRAFEAALQLDRSNSLIMNNYAYYLALREQHLEKAQRMSRQSISLEPGNVSYHDTYAWVLYKAGNYEEACKWIEKAIEGFPHSPTFMEHYGDILFRLGEEEEAVNMWNKAKELGGKSGLLDKKIREKELYE